MGINFEKVIKKFIHTTLCIISDNSRIF